MLDEAVKRLNEALNALECQRQKHEFRREQAEERIRTLESQLKKRVQEPAANAESKADELDRLTTERAAIKAQSVFVVRSAHGEQRKWVRPRAIDFLGDLD